MIGFVGGVCDVGFTEHGIDGNIGKSCSCVNNHMTEKGFTCSKFYTSAIARVGNISSAVCGSYKPLKCCIWRISTKWKYQFFITCHFSCKIDVCNSGSCTIYGNTSISIYGKCNAVYRLWCSRIFQQILPCPSYGVFKQALLSCYVRRSGKIACIFTTIFEVPVSVESCEVVRYCTVHPVSLIIFEGFEGFLLVLLRFSTDM